VYNEFISECVGPTDPGASPVAPPGKEEGPAAARAVASKACKEEKAVDQKACDALVKKILKLDDRLARTEDEAVTATIEKGQYLIDLKACTQRTWGKRLRELRLNPRVASRLMAVGGRSREIGLIGSDLLTKLPQDVHKLEWIVKLSPGPLRELVEDLDCRQKPRATVIRAVKDVLGQVKPAVKAGGRDAALKTIENLLKRLVNLLDDLDPASHDGNAAERVRGLLGTAIERLEPRPGA
jgi:hypothetical protein